MVYSFLLAGTWLVFSETFPSSPSMDAIMGFIVHTVGSCAARGQNCAARRIAEIAWSSDLANIIIIVIIV